MTFSEKMIFLMKLTFTSNKQLAEAVKVDPSLISLLRTARRNAPKNPTHVKAMALYFAKKCEGNYQRIALSEAMGRKLPVPIDTEHLAAILLDWLTDDRNQVGQFLKTFEQLSLDETGETVEPAATGIFKDETNRSLVYYGNAGKRSAFKALIARLMSLDGNGTILLSTDESQEWLYEDASYLAQIRKQMMQVLKKGYRVRRIAAPIYTTEQALETLSQMLPLYLTGQVETYYYPRLRDNVYHRTLAVLPNVASVISTSIGGRRESQATIFTQNSRLVNVHADEFRDFASQCRPAMTSYSVGDSMDELLRCIGKFEGDRGDRIQQSTTLSYITSPSLFFRIIGENLPAVEAEMIQDTLNRAQNLFQQSLAEDEIIDLHSFATVEEVRSGAVAMGASYLRKDKPLYYTPETYALHLRNIIDYIERYPHYHAVLVPWSRKNYPLMVKDGRQALLMHTTGGKLSIFEVSQPYVAEACRDYLERSIKTPLYDDAQRQDTLSRLRKTVAALEAR